MNSAAGEGSPSDSHSPAAASPQSLPAWHHCWRFGSGPLSSQCLGSRSVGEGQGVRAGALLHAKGAAPLISAPGSDEGQLLHICEYFQVFIFVIRAYVSIPINKICTKLIYCVFTAYCTKQPFSF